MNDQESKPPTSHTAIDKSGWRCTHSRGGEGGGSALRAWTCNHDSQARESHRQALGGNASQHGGQEGRGARQERTCGCQSTRGCGGWLGRRAGPAAGSPSPGSAPLSAGGSPRLQWPLAAAPPPARSPLGQPVQAVCPPSLQPGSGCSWHGSLAHSLQGEERACDDVRGSIGAIGFATCTGAAATLFRRIRSTVYVRSVCVCGGGRGGGCGC